MFKKKKSKLQLAQEEAQNAINKTNEKIVELGDKTSVLYEELTDIQSVFDLIRNVPSDKKLKYEELKKIRLNWKQQAEKIEKDYKEATVKNAGAGAAGAGVGVAVVTMGPTAAMGIATTFGVASTGTAISSLSGAAATNAALAWLGGGALAAGGGGMAAGEAFLALAGPVGWAIAGVALLASGLMIWKSKTDQKHIEAVFTSISQRDIKSYDLAIVELNERISRIIDESSKLKEAISDIKTFGQNYNSMTEEQQYKLGAYVNLMSSSTQLLVNPVKGIQPKYTNEDMDNFIAWKEKRADNDTCEKYKDLIVSLANFLYKIDLNERDKKLLWKSMRKNKKMLKSMDISKKEFNRGVFEAVYEALNYKYSSEESTQKREETDLKTVIVYYSQHHGNTKKLLDAIAAENDVTLIDVTKKQEADLTRYDRIGFASGIFYGSMTKQIIQFASVNLPPQKNVFLIATCGSVRKGYFDTMKSITKEKDCKILGEYICLGFDTFGPFKIVGGLAKGHPDEDEIKQAVEFYNNL